MTTVQERARQWAAAEARADSRAQSALLADDFVSVGPVGFMLTKEQWLARHGQGFAVTKFALTDLAVREHGDLAVGIGVQHQEASYQGQPSDGDFRITMIWNRAGDDWMLLGLHLSPIMQGPA